MLTMTKEEKDKRERSKMTEGIEILLGLIKEGVYKVKDGKLYNRKNIAIGRVGKDSGNMYFVSKGYHILAHRLFYAYYHGMDKLDPEMVVTHIDGNKQNNVKENLIQLPRKGMKETVETLRKKHREKEKTELAIQDNKMETATELAPNNIKGTSLISQPLIQEVPEQQFTENEVRARGVFKLLSQGHSLKEIAEQTGMKRQQVYDIKRGKSFNKATKDLRD